MYENFSVPDVHCGHCKATIESALGGVEGVESASVDVDDRKVVVMYDPTVVDRAGVVRAIEASGYAVAGA